MVGARATSENGVALDEALVARLGLVGPRYRQREHELLRPYDILGVRARISASLGVSIFPDDADDAATLMEHADKAMYSAKQAGKNAYCLYSTGRKPATLANGEAAEAALRSPETRPGAARPE